MQKWPQDLVTIFKKRNEKDRFYGESEVIRLKFIQYFNTISSGLHRDCGSGTAYTIPILMQKKSIAYITTPLLLVVYL